MKTVVAIKNEATSLEIAMNNILNKSENRKDIKSIMKWVNEINTKMQKNITRLNKKRRFK